MISSRSVLASVVVIERVRASPRGRTTITSADFACDIAIARLLDECLWERGTCICTCGGLIVTDIPTLRCHSRPFITCLPRRARSGARHHGPARLITGGKGFLSGLINDVLIPLLGRLSYFPSRRCNSHGSLSPYEIAARRPTGIIRIARRPLYRG